ncbi:serine acetyltransferase [uncultured Bacteroides sp.]|uniref:serine O-acetyltransferase n=1 Tax=uncultured Bacteroides sp. TaxID=162156 RepID=UPI0025EEF56F|nr:serine acetyltransferase [uncultured Bacteroides sp.]
MIQSKEDYLYYLECDRIALRKTTKRPRPILDVVWKFERIMRKYEYYENCKHDIFSRIYLKFIKFQFARLSQKLGFSIAINVCGPGLCIEHYGNVMIHQCAHVGANCHIKGGVLIGSKGDKEAPTIGDNVLIGFGTAIFGNIKIANDIAIGANAVVCKNFLNPNMSIGGVPAKVISQTPSTAYITKATDIVGNRRAANIL